MDDFDPEWIYGNNLKWTKTVIKKFIKLDELTLPYQGDFGTSTAWGGGGGKCPLRYFLCSLSYVN